MAESKKGAAEAMSSTQWAARASASVISMSMEVDEQAEAAAGTKEVLQSKIFPPAVQQLRGKIYVLFEEPDSGVGAKFVSTMVLITIAVSIVSFMVETVPEVRGLEAWAQLEVTTTMIFSVEYGLRLACCDVYGTQTVKGFLKSPMNCLDLVAILPWYVEVLLQQANMKAFRVLRAIRLARLFRLFKLGRYSSGMFLMIKSLRNSMQALSVLGFFLGIGVVLFSSLMYYFEKMSCPTNIPEMLQDGAAWQKYENECRTLGTGFAKDGTLCCTEYGAPAEFKSIVDTFWWSIVTMTTVGFGDQYPRTTLGYIVGGVCMLCGILLISLPVAIVGSKFQEAYEDMEDAQFAEEVANMTTNEDGSVDLSKMGRGRGGKKDTAKAKGAIPKAPEPAKRLAELRERLEQLLEVDPTQMSAASKAKVHRLFELFDKARRLDGNIALLREKDLRLQKAITKDFDQVAQMIRGKPPFKKAGSSQAIAK